MSTNLRRGRRRRSVPSGTATLSITDYTAGDSPWIDDLIGRAVTPVMPRCEHLEGVPHRGFVYAAEGVGRCVDCHMGRAPAAAAAFPVGDCQTPLCGRCGTSGASTLLRLVEVVLVEWVVFSAVCSVCEVVLRHEIPAAPAAARVGW